MNELPEELSDGGDTAVVVDVERLTDNGRRVVEAHDPELAAVQSEDENGERAVGVHEVTSVDGELDERFAVLESCRVPEWVFIRARLDLDDHGEIEPGRTVGDGLPGERDDNVRISGMMVGGEGVEGKLLDGLVAVNEGHAFVVREGRDYVSQALYLLINKYMNCED